MLVLLLLLLTTAHAEEAPVRVRNRVSAGVLLNAGAGGAQVEAVVSDRLRMRWRTGPVAGELAFDGRIGVGFSGAGVRLRRTRIPTLAVHLRHERFWLEVGRFRVTGGDWRLADGVQGMAQLGRGVEVGGWLGAVPDPWTTAPAPRLGGGPSVRWTHEVAQVGATVELAGTAAGLDRAALVLDVRVELGTKLEIAGRADLQHGGPSKPVLPADLGVVATLDPRDDLRVRVRYDAWTGLAFLQGWDRDPGIGRFAQRFGGVVPEFSAPQDGPDLTMAHQVAASARWTPAVGDLRLRIAPDVRYRHHVAPERRHARVRLVAGLEGLAKGRVDVGIDGGPTLWRGLWRVDAGLGVRWTPDRGRWLSVDGAVRTVITPGGPPKAGLYADAFVDLMTPSGVSLAAGYRFSSEPGLDRYDAGHTALVRVTWRVRSHKTRGTR